MFNTTPPLNHILLNSKLYYDKNHKHCLCFFYKREILFFINFYHLPNPMFFFNVYSDCVDKLNINESDLRSFVSYILIKYFKKFNTMIIFREQHDSDKLDPVYSPVYLPEKQFLNSGIETYINHIVSYYEKLCNDLP